MRPALRALFSSPGFLLLASVTLALGIAANTSIFTVANEILFRPAPFVKDPSELAAICRAQENDSCGRWAWDDVADMRAGGPAFSAVAAYRSAGWQLRLPGSSQKIESLLVSENYFPMLGVPIVSGRNFTAEESNPKAGQPVAIINPRFCRNNLGGCDKVLGRTLSLNSLTFTIVGVVAEGFHGTETGNDREIWIPLAMERHANLMFPTMEGRHFRSLTVIARLRRGISAEQATSQLEPLAKMLNDAPPRPVKPFRLVVSPDIRLSPSFRAELNRYIGLLFVTSALVLVVACANVANMVLARAVGRRREIATRLALGANRADLVRHFARESLVLAVLSGAAGALLSRWALHGIGYFRDSGFDFPTDWRVILFVAAIAGGIGFLFGILPAFSLASGDISPALKDGAGRTPRSRFRDVLVAAQIAVSLTLMILAGLFVSALQRAERAQPMFETADLIEASLDFRLQGIPDARGKMLYKEILARIATLPGIERAALAQSLPLGFTWRSSVVIPGFEKSAQEPFSEVSSNTVSPGFFRTIGIPIVAGRGFADSDQEGTPEVVVVTRAMAEKYWPGENPIGKQFRFWNHWIKKADRLVTVVGIAQDSRYWDIEEAPKPLVYRSTFQSYEQDSKLLVRTRANLQSAVPAILAELKAIDPELTVFGAQPVRQRIDNALEDRRRDAAIIGSFGVLATVLAAIGLYALMSYVVSRRTREFGVRIALGASSGHIRGLVMGHSLKLAAGGFGAGAILSYALARLAASILNTVKGMEPGSFAAAAALLGVVMLLATAIPAERAIRTDPATVLREE